MQEASHFCTCGETLSALSAEKTIVETELRASYDLQWRSRTRGLKRHLSQEALDHKNTEHHFREAQKTKFECCADR